jgi:hypothetical protein
MLLSISLTSRGEVSCCISAPGSCRDAATSGLNGYFARVTASGQVVIPMNYRATSAIPVCRHTGALT